MDQIIVYGSHYGTTRRYAQQLSERTGIPAVRFREAPTLAGMRTIVYLGGLYAGGVVGLAGTLRGLTLRSGQRLILVTVGLADPGDTANRAHICTSLQKQLPPSWLTGRRSFTSAADRLFKALPPPPCDDGGAVPLAAPAAPGQTDGGGPGAARVYGTRLDFTDPAALDPIVESIRRGEG